MSEITISGDQTQEQKQRNKDKRQRRISEARQMLNSIKTEERSDTSKENLSRQAEGARLDTFEQLFYEKMEKFDGDNKEFRLVTSLQS